jgi:alkylhydroperoxidase family enzyme
MTRLTDAELPNDLPVHNNLVRAAYVNPDMFRGFASLSGRVHSASHLSDRTRELVVLHVAGTLGAAYEWQQHARIAERAGITDAELAALRSGDTTHFRGPEQTALRLAIAVEQRDVNDELWAEARSFFSEVQILDLVMLAGFYGLASRFVLALDVDLEQTPPETPTVSRPNSAPTESALVGIQVLNLSSPKSTSSALGLCTPHVPFVLDLPANGDPGHGRLGGVDPGLGVHPGLLVHASHDRVVRGFRYNPHTSPALLPKSGSCEVIHDSTCHGLRSSASHIRHTRDADISTP